MLPDGSLSQGAIAALIAGASAMTTTIFHVAYLLGKIRADVDQLKDNDRRQDRALAQLSSG